MAIISKNKLNSLESEYLLPLISASAVLRKETYLNQLIDLSISRAINPLHIYEALLQTYLFAGFPVALVSLKIFARYYSPSQETENYDFKKFRKRGIENCKKVYGNAFEKLISNVSAFSPELSQWLVVEGYGKTLAREFLGMKERELCIVLILASLRFEDQLISHFKGAIRFGNQIEQIERAIRLLDFISEKRRADWALMVLQKFRSATI